MSNAYLALLRGVNVGGKGLLPMEALRTALTADGNFTNVKTYIQSGNVLFDSDLPTTTAMTNRMQAIIKQHFQLEVGVVIYSAAEWRAIIAAAPEWWGKDSAWKHNLLALIKPYDMESVIADVGILKPDIEAMVPGDGVLYQSMSLELFGRTTTGKLASRPVYKQMTVRNYNTATKLLALLTNP